jgi:AcrR family transcriptional regulator
MIRLYESWSSDAMRVYDARREEDLAQGSAPMAGVKKTSARASLAPAERGRVRRARPARERLLDAAERLFADRGYSGVSVRDIVAAAGVNLGAVPYHFGTKENLFKEVFYRRAVPLQHEREAHLRRVQQASRGRPALEAVLWALLEPVFRATRGHDAFRRLLGRASMDPTPEVHRLMAEIYTPDFTVVPRELRKILAKLPEEEFYWRLNCLYGVMLFVQADTGKIQTIAGSRFDTRSPETALAHVIPFLAAGLRARRRPAVRTGAPKATIVRPRPRSTAVG